MLSLKAREEGADIVMTSKGLLVSEMSCNPTKQELTASPGIRTLFLAIPWTKGARLRSSVRTRSVAPCARSRE